MSSRSRASSATPFFGGFGLIAIDHLPKPSFNVFRLLHTLGDERICRKQANDVLVTKKKDGGSGLCRMESGGARRCCVRLNPSR